MDLLTNPDVWVALLTLTSLEIVLGIDNLIFISILANRLRVDQRKRARLLSLSLAMFMRTGLSLTIGRIANLTESLFGILGREFSSRGPILCRGAVPACLYRQVDVPNRRRTRTFPCQ